MCVQNMLDLSTSHINPKAIKDMFAKGSPLIIKGLRTSTHQHGWIVFINGDLTSDEVSPWFQPIFDKAVKEQAILVNFDTDAYPCEEFIEYEW